MTMSATSSANNFEAWAALDSEIVALHRREMLMPVEGHGSPIFPATYAGARYNIDMLPDGTRVASIDSVGSQANRMEPLFAQAPYAELVPQVEITYGNQGVVTIFEVGHRLGDAVVRCTSLDEQAHEAFLALLKRGNATAIAKLAPTTLVFGAWDSRDTQAKLPRVVQSVIRAWDIAELTRSAQYNPALDYAALEVFSEEEKKKQEGKAGSDLAQRGYVHVPSTATHGGIIARGCIRRDVTINLLALRRLDGDEATNLRCYILGLALVAATAPHDGFLRAGCLIVPDPDDLAEWTAVGRNGQRTPVALDHEGALDFAGSAAKRFGVGPSHRVAFDRDRAKKDAVAKRTK